MISDRLPVTWSALSRVEHMTSHRMNHYQDIILTVTKEFNNKKLDHLASQMKARKEEEEDDDFVPNSTKEASDGWLGRNPSVGKKGGGGKSKYFSNNTGGGQKRKNSSKAENSPKRSSLGGRPNTTGSMGLPKQRFV